MMLLRPAVSLIVVGIVSILLSAGCGGSSPEPARPMPKGAAAGCQQRVLGIMGAIRRETSGLNCRAINRLISSIPSEPETYLISGRSPRLLWNCRFYGVEGQSVFLRCQHDKKQFSIVNSAR